MKTENRDKRIRLLLQLLTVLYGLSLVYLFYRQTQWTDGSVFESDLPAHIKMVIVDGWYYSLTAFVYRLLYFLPFADQAIAVFLALCSILSVYMTAALLQELVMGKQSSGTGQRMVRNQNLRLLTGLLLSFAMPCYIRGIADGRYIGMESSAIWHNSTYIVMKWLGLLSLLLYLRLERRIRGELPLKKWFLFTVILTLTTGAKPSFLMVFAPVMLLVLIADLLRGVPFSRLFLFGCSVLPSLAVLYLQNAVLFGTSTGNSWVFSPGTALAKHSGHPLIAAGLSILFPLLILISHLPALRKDRVYRLTWLMAAVGFLELFCFSETGKRAADGNFMWGYSFAILLLFLVSVEKWAEDLKQLWITGQKKRQYQAFQILCGAVLLWHLYDGLYFYGHLLQGVSYWMWD